MSLALTNAAVSLKGDCDGATLLRLRGALESAGCSSLLPQDFVSGTPTAPALDEALALFNEARASKLAAAPPPVPSPAGGAFRGRRTRRKTRARRRRSRRRQRQETYRAKTASGVDRARPRRYGPQGGAAGEVVGGSCWVTYEL